MKKRNNKKFGIYLCAIIGVVLIAFGIVKIVKTFNYTETIGHFSHSKKFVDEDSDGKTSIYYLGYYNFTVNNINYTATSDSMYSPDYFNNTEKVLYNPNNPTENILGSDYFSYYLIIVGIIFLFTFKLFMPKQNGYDKTSLSHNTNSTEVTWFLLIFSSGIFFILLMKSNCNLNILLSTMLLPTIGTLLFFVIGLVLLITQNKSNSSFDNQNEETFIENNDTLNLTNSSINYEQIEKYTDYFHKFSGLIQILSGFIWCIIVSINQLIPAILVLISLPNGINTYEYNGREVSAFEFIFGSFSLIQLPLLAIGIIVIIKGIKNMKKDKEV